VSAIKVLTRAIRTYFSALSLLVLCFTLRQGVKSSLEPKSPLPILYSHHCCRRSAHSTVSKQSPMSADPPIGMRDHSATGFHVDRGAVKRPMVHLSLDRSAIADKNKPEKPFAYLSLPGEVRNMIIRLVLVPGAVRPPAYRSPTRREPPLDELIELARETTSSKDILPGIAFLVLNHQIYNEASTLFYSSNIFFLPTGPCDEATTYFSFLAPTHKAQIRHLGIRFSVADITPSALAQFSIGALPDATRRPRAQWYGHQVTTCLSRMWVMKLIWILQFHAAQIAAGGKGLETLTVQGYRSKDLLLKGADLPRVSPIASRSRGEFEAVLRLFDPEVRHCGERVLTFSFNFVSTMVLNIGWPRMRQLIADGLSERIK